MASKFSLESILSLYDNATVTLNKVGNNAGALSRKMKGHVGVMSSAWKKFGGIITGVLAAVSVREVGRQITDFAARMDDVNDISQRVMMSSAALQEFQYAAHAADLTSEDLTSILQKMNNNMGQLGQGTGALFSFLKTANPALARQLMITKDSEEAFTLLMGAIAAETDVAKRAALAQAAFGKAGQPLIDMAGDLNEKRAEARRLGLIVSPEDVKAAGAMHASLLRLKAQAQGLFTIVLARAVKVLGPLVDKVSQWVAANKDLIQQKIEETIEKIVKVAKTAYEIWKRWHPVIIGVVGAMVLLNVAMKIAPIIGAMNAAFKVASAVLIMFRSGATLATVAQWALNAAMDANPVGAVILALTVMIAVVIIVIKYWTQITDALRDAWNWLNRLFSDPWIANAIFFILSPLWLVISAVRTLVDLLSGKGWRSFENLIPPWAKGIMGLGGYTAEMGAGAIGQRMTTPGGSGLAGERGGGAPAAYANPTTRTAESRTSHTENVNRSVSLTVPKGYGLQWEKGGPPVSTLDMGPQ